MRRAALAIALGLAGLAAGCGGGEPGGAGAAAEAPQPPALPLGGEPVTLDPADFTTVIDNSYWPITPGTRWVYRETDAEGTEQVIEVTVTDRTETILGIETRVVHDVVTQDGEVVEDTYDWYAQDADGNIWYFGEDTTEYDEGQASKAGSWRAGVDGAQPGILLPGRPVVGAEYRQEYYEGEAEDAAKVLSLEEKVTVPQGFFERVLMTKEFTPLAPRVLEYKFYAPGVGPVLAVGVSGGSGREELLRIEQAG